MRRPMVNSKGVDTSILYGFTKYLLEIISKEQPTHIAVAFDPPAKTFRHEIYPEYKANRSATPELVKEALEPLTEIVQALDIPVVAIPGFEADDVIGSIAKKFEKEDFEIYMVTPDKDFGQLVSDRIFQYKPGKSGSESEILGKKELCQQYEIAYPEQVIDILTLWGDASDNVPGVRGIGEKGAKKLVAEFGSVENIYNNLDKLTQKQRDSFEEAKDHIEQSKFLVTIKTDIPIDLTEKDLLNEISSNEKIINLFNKYEFNSLKKLLPVSDNETINLQEVQEDYLNISVGSERTILDKIKKDKICAIKATDAIYLTDISDSQKYIKLDYNNTEAISVLEDSTIDKVTFEAKEDYKRLKSNKIQLRGNFYDIEIMHYVLNPERSHKIDLLCRGYLNLAFEQPQSAVNGEQAVILDLFSNISEEKSEKQNDFSPRECIAISLLYPLVIKELEDQNMLNLYLGIEMPLIKVLAEMEISGVKISTETLSEFGESLKKQLEALEAEIRIIADEPTLNISSPKQIGIVLFEKMNLNSKAKKNKNDNYTTDEETLLALRDKHPIIDKILEFRGIKKLLSTYIEPLPTLINKETGKIHTTYTQALTATGRLSSIKPNLQNIPIRTEMGREIRKAFVPSNPNGVIISADYSQIELRIMAHISGDSSMIADFSHGDDIHAATAAKIFKVPVSEVSKDQRRQAKTANFGIIYGISAFGLSQRLGISNKESKELIMQYFASYPGVDNYIKEAIEKAKENGYVKTIFGRKRFLPDINSRNQVVRKFAERNAVNAPIQGSAADIIKLAMINISNKLEAEHYKSKMVMQVHDELVFDVVPEEIESLMTLVKQEMENVFIMSVPLIVDCNMGKNWLDAH